MRLQDKARLSSWQEIFPAPFLRLVCCWSLVVLLTSELVSAQTIGLNFTGATLSDGINLNGFGYAPPDTMGAVGLTQVAEFINGVYTVYNKSTGAQIGAKISDTTFWNNAGLSSSGLSDPRILFDPGSNRWFAAEITTNQATNNMIYVARSNSADLTAGWKGVAFTSTSAKFADYPTLGLDATGVYIGTNNFSSGGTLGSVSAYSIPKTDLTAATPSLTNMTRFDALNAGQRGFTIQPVVDFGPAKGHEALISLSNAFVGGVNRTNLTGTGGPGAAISATTAIAVAATSPSPLATQPDGTVQIDTLDQRYTGNVQEVGNILYMAHTIGVGGRAAIRWTKLDETTNAILQEGTISNPSFDFFQPSIAANANGNVVIGFNRSGGGAGNFIGSFAEVGTTDGFGVTTFGAPIQLKAGQSNYHLFNVSGERWGDYSATRVDPSNPNIFWTFQEYAISNNIWGTQITQIIVPEPGSVVLLAIAIFGLAAHVLWRKRKSAVAK